MLRLFDKARKRMEQVLTARDELPMDRRAMREIGVVLDDADDDGRGDVDVESSDVEVETD